MPGTSKISSTFGSASACSICTMTRLERLAHSVKIGPPPEKPHLSGRVPCASPRSDLGPNLTEATARRASSAVLMCGTCTPATPRSMMRAISSGALLWGRPIAVIPLASAAMAMTSTSERDKLPCSQSSSTQSKPACASISTSWGQGNMIEQPNAGLPRCSFS